MKQRKKTSTKAMFSYRVEKAHHAELKKLAIELNNKPKNCENDDKRKEDLGDS